MKKKINENVTIKTVNVGVFEIRLSIAKIEIETQDKSWKQIYAAKTRPFAELTALIAKAEGARMKKDFAEEERNGNLVHNLCYALYGTTLFFYYPELCAEWIGRYNEFAAGMKAAMEEESLKGVPEEVLKEAESAINEADELLKQEDETN